LIGTPCTFTTKKFAATIELTAVDEDDGDAAERTITGLLAEPLG